MLVVFQEASRDNEKVYFERVPDPSELTPIQAQSFVQFTPMDQELKEPSGIEEVFKHMIPVEVRMMQDEFKVETNNTLMNVTMDRCGRAD